MKIKLCLAFVITISLFNSIQAAQKTASLKYYSLPFSAAQIVTEDHQSIAFKYDFTSPSIKNIVCRSFHSYKTLYTYSDNGTTKQSRVYGGSSISIFTNKERDQDGGDSYSQYHVDKMGEVVIQDWHKDAVVYCYYQTN